MEIAPDNWHCGLTSKHNMWDKTTFYPSGQEENLCNYSATVQHGKMGRVALAVLGLAVLFAAKALCGDQTQSNAEVRKGPAEPTTMVHGDQLYKNYCASCHGVAGKGNGPAAPALKTAPADLTLLAKTNNGKFPGLKVMNILENGSDFSAHGSKDMPVWGPIFRVMGPAAGGSQVGRLREANLTDFLKSIQEK